jgi:preprotein translocase subunit SecG
MNWIYILLTLLMFLDCVILVLLVLLQLPKKEAGAGVAFGGGTTDALFGAGSGNVLTKITKYAAGIFFGLAIIMAMVAGHKAKSGGEALQDELQRTGGTPTAPMLPPPSSSTTAPVTSSNSGSLQTTLISNLPPAKAPTTTAAATNK